MREYERLRTEGKLSELVASQSAARDKLIKDDVTTSSAGDVGSESSISDVQVSHVFVMGSKGGKSETSPPTNMFRAWFLEVMA